MHSLGYIFDSRAVSEYDGWYQNPKNRFIVELEDCLLLDLLKPQRGERVLDIGCGTGRHLQMLAGRGLDTTGIEPSRHALELAKQRLGCRAELYDGVAEDLPFEDNSFDVATLITTLDFVDDPARVLSEAFRVAKDRVFIGAWNRYSFRGVERRIAAFFSQSIFNQARLFSVWELKHDVSDMLGAVPIRWRTVGQMPLNLSSASQLLENAAAFQILPFGGFIGMSVTLVPRYRTQNIQIQYAARKSEVVAGIVHIHTSDLSNRPYEEKT